jgi:prepilin-type N-terminal cleavage/methylation domain-containing protein
MPIKSSPGSGFTLVETMVAVAIIGVLATLVVPNFLKARGTSQTNACVANLVKIRDAKEQWAIEAKRVAGDLPADSDLFGASLYLAKKPACPAGGDYTIKEVGTDPVCSVSGHVLPVSTELSLNISSGPVGAAPRPAGLRAAMPYVVFGALAIAGFIKWRAIAAGPKTRRRLRRS